MEGLHWRGIWKSTTEYNINDVVYFLNDRFTYVCIRKNIAGFLPDNYYSGFELMAGFQVNIDLLDGGEF